MAYTRLSVAATLVPGYVVLGDRVWSLQVSEYLLVFSSFDLRIC